MIEVGCFNGYYIIQEKKDGPLYLQREVGLEPLPGDFTENEIESGTFNTAQSYFISTLGMARRDRRPIPKDKSPMIIEAMEHLKEQNIEKIQAEKLTRGAVGWLSKEAGKRLLK